MAKPWKVACFLLFVNAHATIGSLDCNHRVPRPHEVVHGVHLEPEHVIKRRSISQPMRIHLHYHGSMDALPADHRNLIKDRLLPQAVRYWSDTLLVRATNVPILLRRQCASTQVRYKNQVTYCVNGCATKTICGDIEIPKNHLEKCYYWDDIDGFNTDGLSSAGINSTDFILYVAAIQSERCRHGSTVAYAAYCQQEKALDRPVAGYFSICPDSISTERQDELLSTIKHEILHALGFTAGLYAFYRKSNGDPFTLRSTLSGKPLYNRTLGLYQWSDETIQDVVRPQWKLMSGTYRHVVKMMVTPNVKTEVRRHFSCMSLEGGELEDQGIDGTSLTHWEKRVFENEAMTGTYTQNPVISRITLALMEDTGWYKVKYENAGDYKWGKNLGCDFVKKSCYEWMLSRRARKEDIHPFCEQAKVGQLRTECTRDRLSVGLCNLVEYPKSLAAQYQYFRVIPGISSNETSKFGGAVSLADYCPYLQEFTWESKNIVTRGSGCTDVKNNAVAEMDFFIEKYGRSSRCFEHHGTWTLEQCTQLHIPQYSGSGCYEFKCSEEAGLIIEVQNKSFQCHRAGQVVRLSLVTTRWLHTGAIVCPSCKEICQPMGILCPPESEPPQAVTMDAETKIPCGADAINVNHKSLFITSIVILLLVHIY